MKNIVIKVIVVILGVSVYFNISNIIEIKTLNERNETLQENITLLEQLAEQQDEDEVIEENTCSKLYEVTIQVVSEEDDLDNSITLCTNKVYLGDALDEVSDDLQVIYDPRYDKDYVYGRLVVSFYGVTIEYGEYYQITINGIYANNGIDYIELVDGTSYEFTLVRWD